MSYDPEEHTPLEQEAWNLAHSAAPWRGELMLTWESRTDCIYDILTMIRVMVDKYWKPGHAEEGSEDCHCLKDLGTTVMAMLRLNPDLAVGIAQALDHVLSTVLMKDFGVEETSVRVWADEQTDKSIVLHLIDRARELTIRLSEAAEEAYAMFDKKKDDGTKH